mmetsp:Transcript_17354/g.48344  ORF Transcript_17354/g.48344 Transcript_17354/m.48344 type:complete len:118 (-) Transcript_17354:110-463(-)
MCVLTQVDPALVTIGYPILLAAVRHRDEVQRRAFQRWPEHLRRAELSFHSESQHDHLFVSTFRIKPAEFLELCSALSVPHVMHTEGSGYRFSGHTGLLVLLARLGSTCSHDQLGRSL